jgi:hypothetical protein
MPRLIEDARHWWKMWSVQLAAVFATLLAALAANPAPVLQFLNSLPEEYKPLVPLLTLIVTFGAPTLLRLIQQPKLEKQVSDGEAR